MNGVIEALAPRSESILKVQVTRGTAIAGMQMPDALLSTLSMRPRRRREQWCSSLSEGDLDCLLRVLETDLIPQLLGSYSPARHAPVDKFPSS